MIFRGRQFGLQQNGRRPVPPAFDFGQVGEMLAAGLAMRFGKAFAGQNHAGGTVGDLSAVEFPHAPFNEGFSEGRPKTAVREGPFSCLCPRVQFGVTKIDFGDAGQRCIVDTVALVVFLGNTVKKKRPWEIASSCLMPLPRGGPKYSAPVRPSTLRMSSRPTTQATS